MPGRSVFAAALRPLLLGGELERGLTQVFVGLPALLHDAVPAITLARPGMFGLEGFDRGVEVGIRDPGRLRSSRQQVQGDQAPLDPFDIRGVGRTKVDVGLDPVRVSLLPIGAILCRRLLGLADRLGAGGELYTLHPVDASRARLLRCERLQVHVQAVDHAMGVGRGSLRGGRLVAGLLGREEVVPRVARDVDDAVGPQLGLLLVGVFERELERLDRLPELALHLAVLQTSQVVRVVVFQLVQPRLDLVNGLGVRDLVPEADLSALRAGGLCLWRGCGRAMLHALEHGLGDLMADQDEARVPGLPGPGCGAGREPGRDDRAVACGIDEAALGHREMNSAVPEVVGAEREVPTIRPDLNVSMQDRGEFAVEGPVRGSEYLIGPPRAEFLEDFQGVEPRAPVVSEFTLPVFFPEDLRVCRLVVDKLRFDHLEVEMGLPRFTRVSDERDNLTLGDTLADRDRDRIRLTMGVPEQALAVSVVDSHTRPVPVGDSVPLLRVYDDTIRDGQNWEPLRSFLAILLLGARL